MAKISICLGMISVPPLSTTIPIKDQHLLADKSYEIECITVGSRPPATISWWKQNRLIDKPPDIVSVQINYVAASLSFIYS